MVQKRKNELSVLSVVEDISICEELMFGVNFSKLDSSEISEEDGSRIHEKKESLIPLSSLPAPNVCYKRVKHLLEMSADKTDLFVDPSEPDDDRLFLWASKKGAQLSGIRCCKDEYGGNCIVASQDAKESTVIAVLPRSLRIGQHTACKKLGIPNHTPDLSALSLFLLDVLLLDSDTTTSTENFYPYVACLPRICPNAILMSESEIKYWSKFGEEYATALAHVQSQGELCLRYISSCLTSKSNSFSTSHQYSALMWAISIILSRTHGFGSTKSRWLTPIFDYCNHSPVPNCVLEGDAFGGLVLKTTRYIAAGEELTIDYMVSEDAELVATYGFSLLHRAKGMNVD